MADIRLHNPVKKNFLKKWYSNTTGYIKRKPLGSFFITLGLLFIIIIIGHVANQPKQQATPPVPPKTVTLFSIGEAPKATFQAKIEKAGVIKIIAQAGGVVQSVSVTDGSTVKKGKQLIALSSNYQGGNALALQAQVAQAQYQNVVDTFGQQQDTINKQKAIADATLNNYYDQQSIASQSANNTSSLINSNQSVLDFLNQQLTADQNNGTSSATINTEQSQINTLQGAQNSMKASLSNIQEQTDTGKPQGQLSTTQHDLTIDQLNLQEKSLELNKEVTGLQAALAQVSADTMLPASPVNGVVERVFVHPGELVSPGTELAVVTADEASSQTVAVADVPAQIAQNISRVESSNLVIEGTSYSLKPFYVSTDATDGLLYSIFYTVPDAESSLVTDGQYVSVAIPIGSAKTGVTVPFVPIDAVYQTQNSNYLLVDENNKAVSRQVSVGNVFGSYIEITNGLQLGDQVILNRNIVAGDKVTTE